MCNFIKVKVSLFTISLLFSIRSISCDCIMYPIEKYIDTSKYIVKARVVHIVNYDNETNTCEKVILKVIKIYKGKIIQKRSVECYFDKVNCPFKFAINKKYLLFGHFIEDKFYVYDCSYSDEMRFSKLNIKKVKKYLINSKHNLKK